MLDLDKREYVAWSIIHTNPQMSSIYDFAFWGRKTKDEESRDFSNYTYDINLCEVYTIREFWDAYGTDYHVIDKINKTMYNKNKKGVGTVLIKKDIVEKYLSDKEPTIQNECELIVNALYDYVYRFQPINSKELLTIIEKLHNNKLVIKEGGKENDNT